MNNLLKAAARKHALSNGMATAKWTSVDFAAYIQEHGITERDNLKKKAGTAQKKVEIVAADVKPAGHKPAGQVEAAIADLVAGLGLQSEAPQVDEAAVIALIEKHSLAPRATSIVIDNKVTKQKVERKHVHKDYGLVLAHIAAEVNIAAVGPAGSGKSTMFAQIAEDLGLDYYITGAVQQESKVMGYNDAHGNYVRTPFRDAYENGGMIVMEEFDGSAAKAMLAVNNAVANEQSDFPDGMVKRHEKFVCVMAGNTYGTGASRQYVGRTQLDSATLDRFAFIEIGYDEALEMHAAKLQNDDHAAVLGWVATVQAFRAKVEKAGVRHVVSPRASIMGAKLLKQGLPLDVINKTVLHKGLSADQIKQLSK